MVYFSVMAILHSTAKWYSVSTFPFLYSCLLCCILFIQWLLPVPSLTVVGFSDRSSHIWRLLTHIEVSSLPVVLCFGLVCFCLLHCFLWAFSSSSGFDLLGAVMVATFSLWNHSSNDFLKIVRFQR